MFCRGYGVGYPWQAWFPARQQRHVDHWWQRRRSQKLCMYPGRGVSQVVQGAFRRPLVGPCKLSEVDGNLVFTWRFGAQILTDRIPTYPKLSAFFLTVLMCENQLAEGHLLPEGA